MYQIKDSGERTKFESGMQRDVDTDKIKYHLIASGPMFKRWAIHLTGGAKKYDDNNWMKASGNAELERFRSSAFRHFMQWYYGDRDEDHAAAVFFNINGAEYVRERTMLNVANTVPTVYPSQQVCEVSGRLEPAGNVAGDGRSLCGILSTEIPGNIPGYGSQGCDSESRGYAVDAVSYDRWLGTHKG